MDTRRAARTAIGLAGALLLGALAACGGGGGGDGPTPPGPTAAACTKGVSTGFRGNPDWEERAGFNLGESFGATGSGPAGNPGGDVGIGGFEGQFLAAIVTVRQVDGTLVGSAQTDAATGLVTARICDYAGPLYVEVAGQDGAKYFDESRGMYVDFGVGQRLRAFVPAVDKHVGVTFLTEAAVQRLAFQGLSVVTGQAGARGEKAPPTAAQVRAANEAIRTLINAQVDARYAVDDLTRLPVLIGPATPRNSLPDTARGRYGLLGAAFSKQAGTYAPTLAAPAATATRQFARDAADGVLDGRDPTGASVSGPADRTYDPGDFPRAINASLAAMAGVYGAPAAQAQVTPVIEYGAYTLFSDESTFPLALLRDGRVLPLNPDGSLAATPIATGALRLFPGGGGALFLKLADASVSAVGDNFEGQLGVGDQVERRTVVPVPALAGATQVAGGDAYSIARMPDGRVLAWGSNRGSQLGQPSTALPRSTVPVAVALGAAAAGSSAVAVAAAGEASFAVLASGRVLSWGTAGVGTFGNGLLGTGATAGASRTTPGAVLLSAGVPLADIASMVTLRPYAEAAAAVRTDGTVVAWGGNLLNTVPGGPSVVGFATPVPGPVQVARLLPAPTGLYALGRDGAVWAWGFDPATQAAVAPARLAGLPRIRDLFDDRGSIVAVDFAGARYRLGLATWAPLP